MYTAVNTEYTFQSQTSRKPQYQGNQFEGQACEDFQGQQMDQCDEK